MDHMIYTALSGASEILARQAIVANNLANVDTTGFKAEMSAFRAVPVNGAGMATRSIVAETTPGADMAPGPIEHTGRDLDVAIDGPGWLAVDSGNGREAYTRDGNLQIDSTGQLRSAGHPVLGTNGQPIVLPLGATVSIAKDGTISALQAGQPPNTISQIATLKRVANPAGGMQKEENGLFEPISTPGGQAAALPNDDSVNVLSEALEGSNVSPTRAMVSMIDDAREFGMQMKMLSMADENAQSADKLLDVS